MRNKVYIVVLNEIITLVNPYKDPLQVRLQLKTSFHKIRAATWNVLILITDS